jgi:hypothetical protein
MCDGTNYYSWHKLLSLLKGCKLICVCLCLSEKLAVTHGTSSNNFWKGVSWFATDCACHSSIMWQPSSYPTLPRLARWSTKGCKCRGYSLHVYSIANDCVILGVHLPRCALNSNVHVISIGCKWHRLQMIGSGLCCVNRHLLTLRPSVTVIVFAYLFRFHERR